MNVYLDERRTEITTRPEGTLSDLVHEMKQRVADSGDILVRIECDGIDVTGEGFAEALQRPIGSFDRIDLQSAEPKKLVADALDTARQLLEASQGRAEEVVDLLAQSRLAEAMSKLGESCQAWMQVHQVICNAVGLLGIEAGDFTMDGRMLPELTAVPMEQLRQLKEAMEANDFVLLSDVLAYEFPEAIQTWQNFIRGLEAAVCR